jgi:isoleucyl-tRNA synthetase
MDLVRDLISIGRNVREEVHIKVRQPLSKLIIDAKNKKTIDDLVPLIKEELNVKEMEFTEELSKYVTFEVKPNFKVAGKLFGSSIKEFQTKLSDLSDNEITSLQNGEVIKMNVNGNDVDVNSELVDIRVNAKEGFDAAFMNNNFVVLNTNITKELTDEGVARELISKVQQLRKTKNYDIVDRIVLYYDANEAFDEIVNEYKDVIMAETLSTDVVKKKLNNEEVDLNEIMVRIDTEKVNQ